MAESKRKDVPTGGMQARVTLTRSSHSAAEILSSPDVPASLRRPLARLLAHEKEILGWLAADPARAARFLVDPVSALRSSGLNLPQDLLAELERGVAATRRHQVVPSNVRLDRLTVTVDPTRTPAGSGGAEPESKR